MLQQRSTLVEPHVDPFFERRDLSAQDRPMLLERLDVLIRLLPGELAIDGLDLGV
ncbi:MAG: hypothetical protein M0004_02290 [Actinomycetota bacterium]|nr:hypothetical protein [Actinomycetota bacterium]